MTYTLYINPAHSCIVYSNSNNDTSGSRILTLLLVNFEEVMRALAFAVGLWCSSLVSCGIIKDSEDLSLEAIENASLDGYATIAQLTDEELKIVSLLERIQEKFVTLDEGEKVEVS